MGVHRFGFGIRSSKETAAAQGLENGFPATSPTVRAAIPGAGGASVRRGDRSARFRLRRAWRAGYTAAVLLLAATALHPMVAEAQSVQTLVSNMSESETIANNAIMSQAFTTGSASSGYVLTSVGLRFSLNNTDSQSVVDLLVRIYTTNTDGTPNTLVHTLTAPSSISTATTQINQFTASSGATLDANTTYAAVLTDASGNGRADGARRTASTNESSDRTDGWSISNKRYWKFDNGDNWSESDVILYIEVNGYANASPPPKLNTAAPALPTSTWSP